MGNSVLQIKAGYSCTLHHKAIVLTSNIFFKTPFISEDDKLHETTWINRYHDQHWEKEISHELVHTLQSHLFSVHKQANLNYGTRNQGKSTLQQYTSCTVVSWYYQGISFRTPWWSGQHGDYTNPGKFKVLT